MSTEPKSKTVNPAQMASKGRVLKGQVPQQELPRFAENLVETSGLVEFKLGFKKKRDGNVYISGTANTVVTMLCQLCLDPVRLAVNASISQVVVGSETEMEDLEIQQDVLVVAGETIELTAIIEDDLILNLPMVARHGTDQAEDNGGDNCLEQLDYEQRDEDFPARSNPFAVLNDLKVDKSVD
jgi:uncharacterized protein